jgi:Fe2+ or Zn2+ uptake regulation protein
MTSVGNLVRLLRTSGERVTVARRAILTVFCKATQPLTAIAVMNELRAKGIMTNKTTVYRELRFLDRKNILRTMQFDERKKRYELTPNEHTHHLICTNCKRIEDVVLDHDLDHVEKRVISEKRFKVERHALEFYGLCGECQE